MSKALSITRFILILLSTVVASCSIYLLVRLQLGIIAATWTVWTPLIISILSNILYSCSLNPKNRVTTARNVFAFILAVGWFVTPSYRIHQIVLLTGSSSSGTSFFSVWNCGVMACTLLMIMDIGGLLSGVLSLLEIWLADQASRGMITPASNKTSLFVLPGGQQQYIPLQQPPQQQVAQQPYYQPASAQPYYAQTQHPTTATTYPLTY